MSSGKTAWRKGLGALFGLAAPLALLGCGGLNAGPRAPLANPELTLSVLAQTYSAEKVAGCLTLPIAGQRDCRNSIVGALLIAIDYNYADYEGRFFDEARYGGFGATVAALGLTTAASLANAASANILSAIATGVVGGREAFSREVLADRTANALLTAMRSERRRVLLEIRNGLDSDSTSYPLSEAFSDIFAYYRAGTLPGALTAVTSAVGDEAFRTQENLLNRRSDREVRGAGRSATPASMPQGARETRAGEQLRYMSTSDAAAALAHYFSVGPTPARQTDRVRAIMEAARVEGFNDIAEGNLPVAAFALNPEDLDRRARIARRLQLAR